MKKIVDDTERGGGFFETTVEVVKKAPKTSIIIAVAVLRTILLSL